MINILALTEVWVPVRDFEGTYSVSSYGRVKRLKSGRILKPRMEPRDYEKVSLCQAGKEVNRYVHRLVAQAFHRQLPGTEVNHKKGKSNHYTNLEWITHAENQQHAKINGRYATGRNRVFGDRNGSRTHPESFPRGESHPNARLTEVLVLEIRKQNSNGVGYRTLARRYGMGDTVIRRIIHRETWKHI